MPFLPRTLRLLAPVLLLTTAPLAQPALAGESDKAQATRPAPAEMAAPRYAQPDDPWIYRSTDIPIDRGWLFGELPNGLRYAVRNNGVPPGQVSVRVRIDAGSLHETDSERGFAHLIEHLVFRESSVFGNGEAIPHFQRLGAGLGTDTNALTYPTQTIFHLDLPNVTRDSLDDSLRRISGMIREPRLSTANLATEVPIVLAERRERAGPAERIVNAMNGTFFAGQPLADRDAIGTVVTLQGATEDAVRAFHHRWYRPDKAVVVLVGDMPVQQLAALVEARFGEWKAEGAPPAEPDLGSPQAPADADPANPVGEARVLVEPGQPRNLTFGILRPWRQVTDNLEYNRGLLIDSVAETIINRRLESRARAGASFLQAGVQQDKPSRSANVTYVGVTPIEGDWKKAVADVRAVIADAVANPPSQEDIDRELAEYDAIFANQVEQSRIQAGAKLADDLVNAVDIRESVASPETFLDVFRGMKDRFTPEAVHEHTRAMFTGTVIRALLVTPQEGEATDADLRAALAAPMSAASAARDSGPTLSFADLPPIGKPAAPVESRIEERLGLETLTFGNGVKALLYPTTNEPGRVTVRVRFGQGRKGFAASQVAYAQLAEAALVPSGLGKLGQEQLDRLSTGRKFGFSFTMEEGAFVFEGLTRADDVADQLYLFAAKLATPRWEPAPFLRAKAAALLAYDSQSGSPAGVLNRDFGWLLHGRDPRYAAATPDQLHAATPSGFRDVWSKLLAQGPIEVDVFGDFNRQAVTDALSRTFGALKPRRAVPTSAANDNRPAFPAGGGAPMAIAHSGDGDQAAGLVLWPTSGGSAALPESRKLEVLAQVFSNRLLDSMRERIGASYAPDVGSSWPLDAGSGGSIFALAQLPPDKLEQFFAEADKIAQDLATTPPSADELNRVTEPLKQTLERLLTGHTFWLNLLQGSAFDGQRLVHVPSLFEDYTQVTPEEVRDLAARYFGSRKGWHVQIVPQALAAASAPAARAAAGR